jgi:hypothetical protein
LVAISQTFEDARCFGLNKIGEGQRGDRRRRRSRKTVTVQMMET